jgi:hypothetical protein
MSSDTQALATLGADDPRGRHGRYKWMVLTNTTIGTLMATIDASIVLISLPAIFRGINMNPLIPSNSSYLLWMLMGYMVVIAVLVVTFGRIGDMFGRLATTLLTDMFRYGRPSPSGAVFSDLGSGLCLESRNRPFCITGKLGTYGGEPLHLPHRRGPRMLAVDGAVSALEEDERFAGLVVADVQGRDPAEGDQVVTCLHHLLQGAVEPRERPGQDG